MTAGPPDDGHDAYGRWSRPRTAELLRAIELDVVYHRGEGDWLYTRDAAGAEVRVLDLLGGFGASLFGHNHPKLVAALHEALAARRPQNAQASIRGPAGLLARRLAERVGAWTGKDYVVTLASTGTEAIEAALKHAELEARRRGDRRVRAAIDDLERVRVALRHGARLAPEAAAAAARLAGLMRAPRDVDDLFAAIARAVRQAHDRPPLFLAVEQAFHGKTTGALSLTHSAEFRPPWRRVSLRVEFLPPGDEEALARALHAERVAFPTLRVEPDGKTITAAAGAFTNVAACLAEPIQGEGGIRELSPVYLAALRAAADEHGFPLVLDEIQSGMGRTGRFLASEGARVRGDYVTLSKALGGGLCKLAALLIERDRYLKDFGWLHTSTFADDDLSSTVGLAALELVDDALLRACHEKGARLASRLRALRETFPDELPAVRGRGLMLGFELGELPRSPSPLLRVLGAQRLLGFLASGWFLREHRIRVAPTLSSHGTIRLEPSAYVEPAELERFATALEALLRILRAGRVDELLGAPAPAAQPPLRAASAPPDPEDAARELVAARPPAVRAALFFAERFEKTVGVRRAARLRERIATLAAPLVQAATPHLPPALRPRGPARVGFLAHFLEPGDLRAWEPRLASWSDARVEDFLDRTLGLVEPFHLHDGRVRSQTGALVDVTVVAIPFLPAQVMKALRLGDDRPLELVRGGVELLRAHGAEVIGFGGYTSIVSDNCTAFAAADVAFTSGNSLTAAAALDALYAAARAARIDPARARLGVVGAAGNIGAVLAEVAADEVAEIVLVGRAAARQRLEEAADQLRAAGRARHRAAAIHVATDMAALRECDLILSATNAPRPVILPDHVAADRPVVIGDVAAPRDVDPAVTAQRPSATVLRGGMVHLPIGQTLDLGGLPLATGQVYGCLAETLLLGLDGRREHFSYGPLTAERVRAAADMARRHGFRILAAP